MDASGCYQAGINRQSSTYFHVSGVAFTVCCRILVFNVDAVCISWKKKPGEENSLLKDGGRNGANGRFRSRSKNPATRKWSFSQPGGRRAKMAEDSKNKSGSAATPAGPAGGGGAAKPLTPEQVVAGFNRLRQEQRGLASKAAELEMELNEHKLVIETLREVDPTRKCFRMVGGVLVERTVKEVLPALENNKEQINKIIETLTQQLQTKGRELNEFREKHNIRLMGEEEQKPPAKESPEGAAAKSSSTGVLVS